MSKTILIVIGLACAVISAVGIMHYNNPLNTARRQLYDKDPMVRVIAMKALIEIGDKESIPGIIKLLQDNDDGVRVRAIWALAKLNAKETIPEIKKLLNDKSSGVRNIAVYTLRQLGVSEKEIQEAKEENK